MATCMSFFAKAKQRLTPGAGKKAATATAAQQHKSEDATGSDTTAVEKPRQPDEEQPQQQEEKEEPEGGAAVDEKEAKQDPADEGPKEEREEGKTGEQQQEAAVEPAEPAVADADEQQQQQRQVVEAAESSNKPTVEREPTAEGAEEQPAAAAAAAGEGGEQETPPAAAGKELEPNTSNLSRRNSSPGKAESAVASTAGPSSADPSSSAASTLGQSCSRSSSLGVRAQDEEEASLAASAAADKDSAAKTGGGGSAAAFSRAPSSAAKLKAAASTAAAAANFEAGVGSLGATPLATPATSASGAGPLSRLSSGRKDTGVTGPKEEAAAAAVDATLAGAASMRRRTSLATLVEKDKEDAEKKLEDVIRERDALSKQLEQTAAFYTLHIQRITDIYNSVVQEAQVTEQKKNRYAEKLAELVVAGKVGESVHRQRSAVKAEAEETQPQSVKELREEIQALRVEKQELEERVAELVDRCAALQQALVEAGGAPAISSASSFLPPPPPLPSPPPLSSGRSRHLTHGGGSSTRLWNGSVANAESGELHSRRKTLQQQQQQRQGSWMDLPPALRADLASAMTPAARKSSALLAGGPAAAAAAAAARIAEDEGEGEEEEGVQEEEELLLHPREDRLFKGEETVFQELASSSLQQQHHHPSQLQTKPSKTDVAEAAAASVKEGAGVDTVPDSEGERTAEVLKAEGRGGEGQGGGGGEADGVAAVLNKRLSRKGVEAFLAVEEDDGDNSVLNSIRSRTSVFTLPEQQQRSDQNRLVTPLCCERRTPKGDLREMKRCSCTVCRTCLNEALLSAKSDIRNFVGMDTTADGSAIWEVACPRCGCKQGVSASLVSASTARGHVLGPQ